MGKGAKNGGENTNFAENHQKITIFCEKPEFFKKIFEKITKNVRKTPILLEFGSGDQEMPDGVFLEFFNSAGETTSSLKANYAHYSKEEDIWLAIGDVELINNQNNEKLNTEELKGGKPIKNYSNYFEVNIEDTDYIFKRSEADDFVFHWAVHRSLRFQPLPCSYNNLKITQPIIVRL